MQKFYKTKYNEIQEQDRHRHSWLIYVLMLLLLTTQVAGANQIQGGTPLAGDYEVGDVSADFQTLEEAIDAINSVGISAPVNLLIRPGVYESHITLTDFQRTGQADDWLTITSKDLMNPATLQHDASAADNNWVIKLDAVNHVNINHLVLEAIGFADLSAVIALENEVSQLEIHDNQLISYPVDVTPPESNGSIITTLSGSAMDDISIDNNQFESGNGGVVIEGQFSHYMSNIKITNNIFNEQVSTNGYHVMKMYFSDDFVISGNLINNHQLNAKGIYLFKINGGEVSANQLNMLGEGTGGEAMSVSNINDTPSDVLVIKNNFMTASKNALKISSINTNNIKIYHNSLLATGSVNLGTNSAALEILINNNNIEIKNNILTNASVQAGAYVLRIADLATIASSNNNIFDGQGPFEFSANGVDYISLSDYQLGTALDAASIDKTIDFVDENNGDMHLEFAQYADPDLLSTALSGVLYDVDGDVRLPTTPLIGADELDADLIFIHGFE
ncbi:MAG: hypothetical protein ACSHWU_02830 [Marinicella sp.]